MEHKTLEALAPISELQKTPVVEGAFEASREAAERLPNLSVDPSSGPSGRSIRKFLKQSNIPAVNAAIAYVLTLPSDPKHYLKGKKRQAIRTNLTKSDGLGLKAVRQHPSQARDDARYALKSGANIDYLAHFVKERHAATFEDWVAYQSDGKAIAFARVKIDGDIALLTFLTAIRECDASVVRYRLSSDIFMDLAERKIQNIILYYAGDFADVDGYFAERLGFVKMHVRLAAKKSFLFPRLASLSLACVLLGAVGVITHVI